VSLLLAYRRARAAAGGAVGALLSPSLLVAALLLAACGFAIAGVYVLAGYGWSLVATAGALFLLASALARGMSANG
jgi:hypothetical protein